ncbi:1-acyl-sn-glycerol-3-phosphate acyltransferases [Reichenbachiella faecimaris]|uniref:1-acyl-sn-glycerol-3-phosphate acyltransferases n=1 Tax=Reichenbachiella faecimaris TaxID=692418 RepID=A0A1W2GMJ4_REIFA|nr:1-acyl-sn-glycerol-3-phosphate acyltransferase [Reichenbachiella faecimaris]SMD37811.1 1-acyl-sn-glycerol-3-phosphate acyltransferases [Reichenbachiella faecimaris]
MTKLLAELIFLKILGWEIKGDIPKTTKKCVIAIAPHTSNWDFFIGIIVRPIKNLRSSFLVKKELYKFPPLGWLLTYMGGIPVDRGRNSSNLMDQVLRIFKEREVMRLAITPEGTRSKVSEWKTGFYRIAMATNVPIVPCSFDFKNRVVHFMEEFHPTGNMEEEVAYIRSKFVGVPGKFPELGVD